MTIDYQLVFQASIPVDVFFFSSKQVYIELFWLQPTYISPKKK